MVAWILGALKALVAGVAVGGAALAIYLGVDKELVAILTVIFGPLLVYIVPNIGTGGNQESAIGVPPAP